MSTKTRPELSTKNKYHIEKNRYYELKYYCMQYDIWKKAYNSILGLSSRPSDLEIFSIKHGISNPTERCVIARDNYARKMSIIDEAVKLTDDVIGSYILRGIMENKSYELLKTNYDIPCCRNTYYELYRKFFWVLNQLRD